MSWSERGFAPTCQRLALVSSYLKRDDGGKKDVSYRVFRFEWLGRL